MEQLKEAPADEAERGTEAAEADSESNLSQSPNSISPEDVSKARIMVESKRASEYEVKAAALERYEKAKDAFDRYYDEQDVVSHNEGSLKLRTQQSGLKNEAKVLEDNLASAKKAYAEASRWSTRHKAKLQEGIDGFTKEIERIEEKIVQLDELIPRVAEAEKYIRSNTESELKRAVEAARFRVETI